MAEGNETSPLLSPHDYPEDPPAYSTITAQHAGQNVTLPPIGPDELPPPYTPSAAGGVPVINCKVCQATINIDGKQNQHVVKCAVCKEATPIRPPPGGKKYVRCPCNCLLICRGTAQRIACPRAHCQRIITLGNVVSTVTVRTPGTSRIRCANCNDVYLFDVNSRNQLARCPHCRTVSSVGANWARTRAMIYFIIGFIFIGAGVGVTVATYELAAEAGGIYVVWIGAFISGLSFLIRGCYFACLRVSNPVVEDP